MRALVVEDDAAIRRLVRDGLQRQGIDVEEADSVADALRLLREHSTEVLILDLTLPDGTGAEVLAYLRETGSTTHVIVLSGAITELDRIKALDQGADDYVVKPFFVRELTARVLAVQRRLRGDGTGNVRYDGLEIDLGAKRVLVDGLVVDLTAKEHALLAFLATRPGQVFSREQLLRAVWNSDPAWQGTATVTEHVRRLRRKISRAGRSSVLQTVSGGGYRFDPPPSAIGEDRRVEPAVLTIVDGVVVQADAAAVAMLGANDAVALIGRRTLDLVSPRSLGAAEERVALRAAGSLPRSQVLLLEQGGGGEVAIEVSTWPAEWEGRPAHRVELRLAADESVRLRQLFTGVLSDLADAVIVTDMRLHIRSWNAAAERLYGWTEAEVLGRHLIDVLVWESGEEQMAVAAAELHATGRWHGDARVHARDGATLAVRATTNVVRDAAGEGIGIVSVNRPVDRSEIDHQVEPSAGEIADLRRGIAAGELVVFYQPVVDLADRAILTVEALVRWRHPVRGLLPPDLFIPLAERSSMIVEIGAVVLDEACRQVGAWRRAGLDVNLAVNLSGRELADPQLFGRIMSTASESGLGLRNLWLEVTETSLVDDVDTASALLDRLAELGVGISIDDFGTGWASLTYLREFPVHVLKIDRSFVSGIDRGGNSAAIARSIVALAAELELVVVAEGIETEAEADVLRELGCTIGQGYLFGRPTAADGVDLSRMRPIPAGADGR